MGNGGKPDVMAVACMKDCVTEPNIASFLPDFARNNHGNLAEQQRGTGPHRGADTTKPAPVNAAAAVAAAAANSTVAATPKPTAAGSGAGAGAGGAAALALAQKHTCTACHGADTKIVGPGFKEMATKYAGRADAEAYLAGKIRAGGLGVWGAIPMPPQTLPEADLKAIAAWLAGGAKK